MLMSTCAGRAALRGLSLNTNQITWPSTILFLFSSCLASIIHALQMNIPPWLFLHKTVLIATGYREGFVIACGADHHLQGWFCIGWKQCKHGTIQKLIFKAQNFFCSETFPILSPIFLWNATEVISRALRCASTHFYKLHEDSITSTDDCNPRIQASNQVTPGNAAQATDWLH